MKKSFFIRFILALIALIISIVFEYTLKIDKLDLYVILPITLSAYLLISYDLFIKSFKAIKNKSFFSEVTLTLLSSIAAFAIGQYVEGLAVTLFFQLGEFFEDYALNKSRDSIKSIMNLRPDFVIKYNDGIETKVKPEDMAINDLFIVKPGERVPLDGIIIKGSSSFDTSSITGESLPKDLEENQEIMSGFVNLDSPIVIKSTKEFYNSTVAKILDLVENATNKKTKSEKFISKFSKIYTPIVIILVVIISVVPPLVFGLSTGDYNWGKWIFEGATLLVISCPCALVISVPMAYFSSIGIASKNKVLIKGSNYLDLINKADTIFMDKTGTITKGKFEINKTCPEGKISSEELLKYAAIGESYSNHPIAKTIVKQIDINEEKQYIKDFKEIKGKGTYCKYNNKALYVGNEGYLLENNIKVIPSLEVGTIVYVGYDEQFLGSLIVRDIIKENTVSSISLMRKNGIKSFNMLTGDNEQTAQLIAKEAGIDNIFANLLPIDKTKIIEEYKNKALTIFVGDGVNDAPSLITSDIGISMGQLGSDSAIEASDIVIMDDDLRHIAFIKKLAKKNKIVVNTNIIFAIVVKIAILLLTIFELLGPYAIWLAIFADVGVTIICCINSLLLMLTKENNK
ncbi:MAG: heavy metal translocating P-type ATPase [Bacilli bacterium]